MADAEHPSADSPSVVKILELLGSFDENLFITSASGRILFASCPAKEFFLSDITGRNLNEIFDDTSSAVMISEAIRGNPVTLQAEYRDSPMVLSMLPCVGYLVIVFHLLPENELSCSSPSYIHSAEFEFRQALASMSSALTLLSADSLAEDKKFRALSVINHSIHRLLRVFNNISDLSKSLQKQWKLNAKPLDLSAFCDALVKKVAPLCENRGILLSAEFSDLPEVCNFDPGKLERAILNIFSNALLHTKKNETISLRAKRQEDRIIIRITDNGTGISASELPYVFTKYDSPLLKPAGLSSPDGAGFGLAVARAILELHKGSIALESVENEGTTATLSFPENLAANADPDVPFLDPLGGLSALLIELSPVFDYQEYQIK